MSSLRYPYNNSALLIGLKKGGSGGGGGEIPLPSGNWNVLVTDTVQGYFPRDKMMQNAANINNSYCTYGVTWKHGERKYHESRTIGGWRWNHFRWTR